MPRLASKIAFVTGSGQGVGQGIAYALAGEGATIAVVGRTMSKLEATVTEIRRRGGKAVAVECDIKQADALAQAVESVVAQLGGIDILVNNAQEVPLAPLLSLSEAALAAGWESGPLATLRLMKLCHPHLKYAARNGGAGNIVNLCTVAAMRWDVSGYGGYAAVKEATRQLTRAAACEWAADGIRTNAILPLGDSPAMAGWTRARPQEAAAFISTVPMQRVGECEADIGRFVATLVSDDCRYINGQSIAVDGGQAFLG
ncbi:MAG: NAD(P)-dependent dehydrogenase, short-chain alcohol dehydrogenase family [Hydrocarboniphaga sp.]|uniref:SDR family NAD(P)-dependent oxidoreductase n=1 Tax=Hydrocarboniphaga sp. TaxID=2033016 RepID=UPI00261BE1E2|nr:SDR family oxidoreductase [Hydrocarboniphaga sp.]MDB5971974.1 NAD(P)-dependent dehydrogenase, short-chain alcohol dehydrogenase family [Hydrocarboniphaga sp.]